MSPMQPESFSQHGGYFSVMALHSIDPAVTSLAPSRKRLDVKFIMTIYFWSNFLGTLLMHTLSDP